MCCDFQWQIWYKHFGLCHKISQTEMHWSMSRWIYGIPHYYWIPVHVVIFLNSFPRKTSLSTFYPVDSMNGDALARRKGRSSPANALPLKNIIMEKVNLAKPSRFLIAEINIKKVVTLLWLQMPGYISKGSATHKYSICYIYIRDYECHLMTIITS